MIESRESSSDEEAAQSDKEVKPDSSDEESDESEEPVRKPDLTVQQKARKEKKLEEDLKKE